MSDQNGAERVHLKISSLLKQYSADESGATSIEYGLLGALISVMAITGMSSLGSSVGDRYDEVALLFDGPSEPPVANSEASGP